MMRSLGDLTTKTLQTLNLPRKTTHQIVIQTVDLQEEKLLALQHWLGLTLLTKKNQHLILSHRMTLAIAIAIAILVRTANHRTMRRSCQKKRELMQAELKRTRRTRTK